MYGMNTDPDAEADKYISDPNDVVKVQEKVSVTVTGVDIPRGRISLSMKSNPIPGR